jgi:hypothetical protein
LTLISLEALDAVKPMIEAAGEAGAARRRALADKAQGRTSKP